MHQRDDGRLVLGEQEGTPKNEAHAMRLQGRPNNFPSPEIAQEHGRRLLNDAARLVPSLEQARIATAYIGWRPLPLDGHPVLGSSTLRPDRDFELVKRY